MMKISFSLPWPPSINHYYVRTRRGMCIGKQGKEYRKIVQDAFDIVPDFGKDRLEVYVVAHPPDRRRRDIDNINKCLLDSLEESGIFSNDEQVDVLMVVRSHKCEHGIGSLDVYIKTLSPIGRIISWIRKKFT